jgi:hypothetical protein
MNDLERYFRRNRGRLIHKWQHYFEIYDRHFRRFRGRDVRVVEFGVSHGGSLAMWRDYFGRRAHIVGVDINPECATLAGPGIDIVIGDQEDRDFLRTIGERWPRIDVLIDDGGHTMAQQIATFDVLFPRVHADGVYLCEDLHTSYRPGWGGGRGQAGTFVEHAKRHIDLLNAWHSEEPGVLDVTDFTRTAQSMHFYDSVVVIEKRPRTPPEQVRSGYPAFGPGARTPDLGSSLVSRLARIYDRLRGR